MKLAELFGKGKTVFSCEVFPPKRDTPVDSIYTTLDGLKDIRPDFISVTYGAGGSKVNQTPGRLPPSLKTATISPLWPTSPVWPPGKRRLTSSWPI